MAQALNFTAGIYNKAFATVSALYGEKMFFQNVMADSVFAGFLIILVLLGLWRWRNILIYGRKMRLAEKSALDALNTEKKRILELPILNKQWLMKMPEHLIPEGIMPRRSYGTRYNRTLIVDECGEVWVGLVIPEILKDLQAGEYVWRDYYIPFRGDGESISGKAMLFDDTLIHIYPSWMKAGEYSGLWSEWVKIEKKFNESWMLETYQTALRRFNKESLGKNQEKRNEFKKLEVAANISTWQKF